ncbi:MAG: hypothetical protein IPK04_07310 [Bdellovibrionales bacterium]|nr:hypothetical protein [Bdellovibrionales bacterium]
MKVLFNTFIVFLCMSLLGILTVSSAEMKFSEVNNVGLLKHKVIYSSEKFKIKKTDHGTRAYVKMIAMWGLEVYEVGVSEFICTDSGKCQFNQWIPSATYEKCKVTGKKAKCYGKLGGTTESDLESESYPSNRYEEEPSGIERASEREGESERESEYWEYPSTPF